MLALSQSFPSYPASASPAATASSTFCANSLATNQTPSISSSLSFSETLAGLQAENASSPSAPVSFPSSSPLQSGTPSSSTPSYSTQSYSTQPSNQDADNAPAAPSNSSQSAPVASSEPSSTDGDSSSAQNLSTDQEPKNSELAQQPAKGGTSIDQGVKKNSSPAASGATQQDQGSANVDSYSSLTADRASFSPEQGRSLSGLSTGTQQAAGTGTKASDAGKPEPGKRHRKANEASQAGGSEAPSDSVAATLLAAANSSASAPSASGTGAVVSSDSNAGSSPALNKNNLAAGSSSPNALAFAVKLQSAGATPGASATGSLATPPGAAPSLDDSSGDQGLPKFAEQLQAETGAAQLAQEPASLTGGTFATMQGTSGFTTASNEAGAQPSAGADTNSPQLTETDGADADNSTTLPAPLRSMQVQINGQDNQRIDLRLVERAGTLAMSVRSPDSTLNRNLQDHLPELMTKLADQPGQAEWWTPKTQAADGGSGPGNGGGSKEDSSGSQGQQSQTGQDSGKQQGGRQSNQPKWVEELAALGNSNTTRKETIWHQ